MPQIEIPFREWLPDQPDHNNPGLVDAKNVVLRPGGYNPIKGLGSPDGAASSLPWERGSHLYRFEHEIVPKSTTTLRNRGFVYHEDDTVYLLDYDGSTVDSLAVSTRESRNATFARFGTSLYVGAERVENIGPQTTSLVKVDVTDGSAPKIANTGVTVGTCIARVGQFLMTGDLNQSNTIFPYVFRWSGFGTPEDWAISELTQAGSAAIDTPHLGRITAIAGGRTPMIFQERGITRINYVGPPLVWAQRLISEKYGVTSPSAIVDDGQLYYFMNPNGVFATDGASVNEISQGFVSEWVRAKTKGYAVRIHGSYHPESRCVFWGFETPDDTTDTDPWPYTLIYSTETRQFTYGDFEYYGASMGEARTENSVGAESENVQFSVVPQSGVSTDSKLSPHNGSNVAATMTTGHLASAGERTFVDGVEPIYEGSGATAALSGKERLRDAASFGAYTAEHPTSGVVEVTEDARSVATSIRFAAGETWSNFSGVVANVGGAGER